jgi:hypothetical protein
MKYEHETIDAIEALPATDGRSWINARKVTDF